MRSIWWTVIAITLLWCGTAVTRSSTSEDTKLLKAIDSICGDTWCEGDFEFKFESLRSLPNGSVEVRFVMSNSSYRKQINTAWSEMLDQNSWDCSIKGKNGVYHLVAHVLSGRNAKGFDTVYEGLNGAIGWAEEQIQGRFK